MQLATSSPVLFSMRNYKFPKLSLTIPVLPLKRKAFHMPESDTPWDFEARGTWGGAGILMDACIKKCSYLGAGEGPRREEKNANPVACAFKK